jgi:ribulose-phosphate 3-epimerase
MDCHMMVAEPEKASFNSNSTPSASLIDEVQWVNDIADAGGALYCFHMEATC